MTPEVRENAINLLVDLQVFSSISDKIMPLITGIAIEDNGLNLEKMVGRVLDAKNKILFNLNYLSKAEQLVLFTALTCGIIELLKEDLQKKLDE